MKLKKKLASRRGETLTEALVGILIVALSSVALVAMVTAASHMNTAAAARDQALYDAVKEAESGTLNGGEASAVKVVVQVEVAGKRYTFNAARCGEDTLPLYAYEGATP